MIYLVSRSYQDSRVHPDAPDGVITKVHGYTVVPELGQYGGFLIEDKSLAAWLAQVRSWDIPIACPDEEAAMRYSRLVRQDTSSPTVGVVASPKVEVEAVERATPPTEPVSAKPKAPGAGVKEFHELRRKAKVMRETHKTPYPERETKQSMTDFIAVCEQEDVDLRS